MPADAPATGVALVDQVRNLDWVARQVEFIGELPQDTLVEILEKLQLLVALAEDE